MSNSSFSFLSELHRCGMQVLAISDVIIYKTCAGRLHHDMFTFLSDSSKAFQNHFAKELKNAVRRSKASFSANTLAPSAIVFHETQRTNLLGEATGDAEQVCLMIAFCLELSGPGRHVHVSCIL